MSTWKKKIPGCPVWTLQAEFIYETASSAFLNVPHESVCNYKIHFGASTLKILMLA